MNIGVNTRLLLKNRLEGIGRFSHETLRRITASMPEHRFTFFFDRAFDDSFIYSNNVKGVSVFPQARHPLLYQWWFEHSLPRALKKYDCDLLFSPEGYISLKSEIPAINVVHDINFEHHPELVDKAHRRHFKNYFPQYCAKAAHIITVSEFSKQDICSTYSVPDSKVTVAYNGVSGDFKQLSETHQQKIRDRFSNGLPYFLFVGSIRPRKNLVRLIQAFDLFRESSADPFKLILVGARPSGYPELDNALSKMIHRQEVILTGRLADESMREVLASAYSSCYIPLYEGFGMPIIESFASNVPVIASDVSSIPEISSDAALLCDPLSVSSISDAMLELSRNAELVQRLKEKGIRRAEDFSWDDTADKISQIIKRILG